MPGPISFAPLAFRPKSPPPMSRSRVLGTLFLGSLLLTASSKISSLFAEEDKPKAIVAKPGLWTLDKGLAQPESAYFEPTTQTIYVSNVVGSPGEKDGKGYISKVSPDGKMLTEKWVEGLERAQGNALLQQDALRHRHRHVGLNRSGDGQSHQASGNSRGEVSQ